MANDTFEVYSLTSKLTLDTSQFDRSLISSTQKMKAVPGDLKRMEVATKSAGASINNDLGSALTSVAPKLAVLSAGGAVGLAVAGLDLLVAAITGTVAGIWSLANVAADAGGEVFDLTQRVNFSAVTISGLGQAGKRAGVDMQSFSTSLGIFDKTMEKFNEGNKETVKTFKELNITSRDNETALRQSFKALNDLGGGHRQVALAMQLFGKSGKEILAVIKETNGDIEAAIEKYRRLGLVISDQDAAAADAFGDSLAQLQEQLSGTARRIGQETLPAFTVFFDDLSAMLAADNDKWYSWANVINSATTLALGSVEGLIRGVNAALARLETGSIWGLAKLPYEIPRFIGEETASINTRARDRVEAENAAGIVTRQMGAGIRPGTGYRGGGGGGGKSGGTQKDVLDSTRASLVQLNSEYRKYSAELLGSANASGLAAEKEKILAGLMHSLKQATKERISEMHDVDEAINAAIGALPAKAREAARALVEKSLAQFKDNQELKNAVEVNKKAEELTQGWRREIEQARGGTDQYSEAIAALEKEFSKYGATLDAGTRKELEHVAALKKELDLVLSVTRARQVLQTTRERTVSREMRDRPPWIDLGGGSTVGGEPATTGRPRVATAQEQVIRERLEIYRDNVRRVAYETTNLLDRALYDGFTGGGVKSGLASLGMGLLDIVRNIFLKELEEGLTRILTNAGGGKAAGGGGLFGTLLSVGLGAISGIFGGGPAVGGLGSAAGGTIGKFADGGYVRPNTWYWRGERGPELVKSGPQGDSVMSNANSMAMGRGGNTFITNVYAQDYNSFASRRTETQMTRAANKMMQRAA